MGFYRRIAVALLVAALASPIAAPIGGCDLEVDVLNGAPRLTWIAVQPESGDVADVTLWVSDVEGDPVDVSASWQAEGSEELTPITMTPGGHGLVGLTTHEALFDPNGQPHLILWDTSEVSGTVRLVLVPDDRESGEGQEARSPWFDVSTGLPEPVQVESVED